jgi:redox-sensing transcriptional repressor
MDRLSDKVVGRLTRYRALLSEHFPAERTYVFSHEIAAAMRLTASQVRRDLMCLGYQGVPHYGYEVSELIRHISAILDEEGVQPVAVVGAGNLGRALVAFLEARRANLRIIAAFDMDPAKVGRTLNGVRCHPMQDLEEVVTREQIGVVILCVPGAAAQGVADRVVRAGVRGILNFAPVPLRLPPGIALEEMDVTSALEKVTYFANRPSHPAKEKSHARRERR